MTGDAKILAARVEAQSAKASFLGNVEAIKHRLSPSTIVESTIESARDKADVIATGASDTIRTRPVLSGATLGVAILVLARRPLKRWLRPPTTTTFDHQRAERFEEGIEP